MRPCEGAARLHARCENASIPWAGGFQTEELLTRTVIPTTPVQIRYTLTQRGAELPQLKPLDSLLKATAGISAKFSNSHAAD